MERKLRTALAIEHQRRVVAEGRADQIASLSPVEQAMLAAWARTARLLHAPKPRCLCCGGPLFWMCIVPWLICVAFTGGSPLVLIAPAPPAEADTPTSRAPAAGLLHARGTPTRKKPVLIVPGMTSTALEVWRGTDCYKGAHRRRLWSFRESLTLAVDPSCLRRHLALNKSTWDDLDGISVRASTGLSAADAFGPLNLWGELLRNLAILDYDERSVHLLGYDWRLSPRRLQRRDGWFTQLRREAELLKELNGEKVVLVAHSLGATHVLHFFGWVEAREPGWTEAHVSAFVSIGGAFLGSAKAYAYPVTGEMTESIGLGAAFAAMLEKHGGLGRTSVAELTRTWASVPALLPRGGTNYWSTNGTFLTIEKPAPDVLEALRRDAPSSTVARALLDRVADGAELSVDGALDLLEAMLPAYGALLRGEYEIRAPSLPARKDDHRYVGNPLNAPLPRAKNLQVYCLYGFGQCMNQIVEARPTHYFAHRLRQADTRRAEIGLGAAAARGRRRARALPRDLQEWWGCGAGRRRRDGAARVFGLSLRERLGRLAAQPVKGARQTQGIRARGRRPARRVTAAARRFGWVGER